jgi:hypothetical protein
MITKLDKYKENLRVIAPYVFSYNTCVALIADGKLIQQGKYSTTTQKHINYVAEVYDLKLIKPHQSPLVD